MSSSKKKKQNDGLSAGDQSVVIGGSVQGSNIVVGNHNTVSSHYAPSFTKIYQYVEDHPKLTPTEKNDVKAELQEVEKEVQKGTQADETFLARRFRNIQRMAPDIVDVAFETLKNPISGVATAIQKIAKRMADEAGENK